MPAPTNLYKLLRTIVREPALLVGTVSAHHADDTSTITLPDGATLRARGTGVAVSHNAFVRAGVVEGEAPALDLVLVDV